MAKTIGIGAGGLLASRVSNPYFSPEQTAVALLLACVAAACAVLLAGVLVKQLRRMNPSLVLDDQGVVIPVPPPLPSWGKVPTWWCHVVDSLGLCLIGGIFIFFGLAAVSSAGQEEEKVLSPEALWGNILTFSVLVAAVYFIVHRRVRWGTWLGLRWREWPHFFWIGPAVVILMWGVMGALSASGYIAWLEKVVGSSSTQDAVALLRESKDSMSVALMAFSAVIVAPLAEEVIFRGYLYPVAKSFAGSSAAIFFSALLFAACHGNIPLMLPLFLLGILLALAYEWTGSIWAAISIHFFFNGATVAMQLALRAGLFPEIPSS